MKKLSKLVSLMLSAVLCVGTAIPALAIEYNIADGTVYVENDETEGTYSYQGQWTEETQITYTKDDADIVITGSSTENAITVGENVTDTIITLKDINIEKHGSDDDAFSIGANSDITVELDGNNTLIASAGGAGLEL